MQKGLRRGGSGLGPASVRKRREEPDARSSMTSRGLVHWGLHRARASETGAHEWKLDTLQK